MTLRFFAGYFHQTFQIIVMRFVLAWCWGFLVFDRSCSAWLGVGHAIPAPQKNLNEVFYK
jgi:hypothetical protein